VLLPFRPKEYTAKNSKIIIHVFGKNVKKNHAFFLRETVHGKEVFSGLFFSVLLDTSAEKNYNTIMFRKFYKKLFPDRYYASPSYCREAAAKYDSKLLKYVTERLETGDIVLCKDAYICVRNGFVYVNSETESIFKCEDLLVQSGELMSHDGVIFTGPDQIQGKERSIVCYFKYYR